MRFRFGPVDAKNPGCGCSIEIESELGHVVLLGTDPDTGAELKTEADCLRVAVFGPDGDPVACADVTAACSGCDAAPGEPCAADCEWANGEGA